DSAAVAHMDPNTWKAIASIENSLDPNSNAMNPATQYKGLFQLGTEEWQKYGQGGNLYSAKDNAMGAARLFEANKAAFKSKFNRDPNDIETYMLHQQGLGFYTNPGAIPEGHIRKNPYPGMFGPQTMGFGSSFEQGWGRELERRKQLFANSNAAQGGTGPVTTASAAPSYIEAHGAHSSVMRDGRIDES